MTEPSIADSASAPNSASTPATAIPDTETPTARCPYCSRPFRTEQPCTLHLGDAHGETWTDEERATYEAAVDDEETTCSCTI